MNFTSIKINTLVVLSPLDYFKDSEGKEQATHAKNGEKSILTKGKSYVEVLSEVQIHRTTKGQRV